MARQSKHPEEFRRQAAALVLDSGRSIRDVARELGVNHETLRNWVDKLRQELPGGQPGDLSADERAELVTLRRQVAQLERFSTGFVQVADRVRMRVNGSPLRRCANASRACWPGLRRRQCERCWWRWVRIRSAR